MTYNDWYAAKLAQSAGAVEYTECFCAKRQDPATKACPVYDTKLSNGKVQLMLELWGMQSTPSLPLLPDPLWLRVVAPYKALSMAQIELNCALMLKWITWNKTVLTFKLCTHAKLNCLILNCFYTKLKCLKKNCFWHWNCT